MKAKLADHNKLRLPLIIALIFIIMPCPVLALGLFPASKVVEFHPGVQQTISMTIVNTENRDMNLQIYPRGDLAQYASLENKSVHMSEMQNQVTIKYQLKLPDSFKGNSQLEMVVEENTTSESSKISIGGALALVQKISIESLHTGKYLEETFSSAAAQQSVAFSYYLSNKGSEDISNISAELQVFDSNLNLLGNEHYDFGALGKGQKMKALKTSSLQLAPGMYYAKTRIDYDGSTIFDDISFSIGEPSIAIEAINSESFRLGNINQLNFLLYNSWFESIGGVYGDVTIKDSSGKQIGSFRTVSADVPAFSRTNLYGFWDTANVSAGEYSLAITISYRGITATNNFELMIAEDSISTKAVSLSGSAVSSESSHGNSGISLLVICFIVLMIMNLILLILIGKARNKGKEN